MFKELINIFLAEREIRRICRTAAFKRPSRNQKRIIKNIAYGLLSRELMKGETLQSINDSLATPLTQNNEATA